MKIIDLMDTRKIPGSDKTIVRTMKPWIVKTFMVLTYIATVSVFINYENICKVSIFIPVIATVTIFMLNIYVINQYGKIYILRKKGD